MDELELSGRRHLSAKRAAREHRYHSDYIGQLIRSGKVAGQKVGRSWYVDAESLSAYLKGESQPVVAPTPEPTPAPAPVVAPAPAPEPVSAQASWTPEPEHPVIEEIIEQKKEEGAALVHITKVEEPIVESQPVTISAPTPVAAAPVSGLRFVPDEDVVPAVHTMPAVSASSDEYAEEDVIVTERAPRSRVMSAALVSIALVAFVGAVASSYFLVHRTIVVGDNATAALQLSTD